jgi:hypothetical protein
MAISVRSYRYLAGGESPPAADFYGIGGKNNGRRRRRSLDISAMARGDEIRRALNVVAIVAIIDAVLLVPLLIAAVNNDDSSVHVLGPLHGTGFLILVALVVRGTLRDYWGWWFPAATVVTGGPPGCLVGDVLIRRKLKLEEARA